MPYRTIDEDAELFLEHNGVKVYHVYRDDDYEQGTRPFNFDTREDSREFGSFSVRDLAAQLQMPQPGWGSTDEEKKIVLRRAIDQGLIKAPEEE
jgi:hypothetical protein